MAIKLTPLIYHNYQMERDHATYVRVNMEVK